MSTVVKLDGAGTAVRSLRESAGLSLEGLAERLGWDAGRLSKYENNKLGLSLPVIESIAGGLDMPPFALLLACLCERYPGLRRPDSEEAALLRELIASLE